MAAILCENGACRAQTTPCTKIVGSKSLKIPEKSQVILTFTLFSQGHWKMYLFKVNARLGRSMDSQFFNVKNLPVHFNYLLMFTFQWQELTHFCGTWFKNSPKSAKNEDSPKQKGHWYSTLNYEWEQFLVEKTCKWALDFTPPIWNKKSHFISIFLTFLKKRV